MERSEKIKLLQSLQSGEIGVQKLIDKTTKAVMFGPDSPSYSIIAQMAERFGWSVHPETRVVSMPGKMTDAELDYIIDLINKS